jgi:biotin carboxyl carrier protein
MDRKKQNLKQPGEYVLSPLPGKVLSVNVKVGQKIKKGDLLLLIDPTEMEENGISEILASYDAVVKQVYVKADDCIETNTKLLNVES